MAVKTEMEILKPLELSQFKKDFDWTIGEQRLFCGRQLDPARMKTVALYKSPRRLLNVGELSAICLDSYQKHVKTACRMLISDEIALRPLSPEGGALNAISGGSH